MNAQKIKWTGVIDLRKIEKWMERWMNGEIMEGDLD